MADRVLPPGQIETRRFPVVGERSPSAELSEPSDWSLEIVGLVETPLTLTLDQYLALPHQEITRDIHCVTSWTRFDATWTGIPLSVLLDEARPSGEARFVSFTAFS
ncbi:MAG: molybdopterin-dependent oxidoreductase, partial [Halobacteriales archaeon]|nr:molybdopterin-dependent oxidoreductase [Halobacteriales archaeon]